MRAQIALFAYAALLMLLAIGALFGLDSVLAPWEMIVFSLMGLFGLGVLLADAIIGKPPKADDLAPYGLWVRLLSLKIALALTVALAIWKLTVISF